MPTNHFTVQKVIYWSNVLFGSKNAFKLIFFKMRLIEFDFEIKQSLIWLFDQVNTRKLRSEHGNLLRLLQSRDKSLNTSLFHLQICFFNSLTLLITQFTWLSEVFGVKNLLSVSMSSFFIKQHFYFGKKTKQMLNFYYLKIIHIILPRSHSKTVGHILKFKYKKKCVCVHTINHNENDVENAK